MHEQDQKFKKQWEKNRKKGRWMYGLTHGSVFGLVIYFLINIMKLKDKSFQDVFLNSASAEQLLTMVMAGTIGYATLKWWMNQNIYQKIIDREKDN